MGDRGCRSEGEAAAQPASGGGAAQGEFPLSTLSLCSSSSAGALTSSPWASPRWPPPLSAVAPQRRPLQGQGAAVRSGGFTTSLKSSHACCTLMHGSRGLCSSPPSGFIVHLPSLCSGFARMVWSCASLMPCGPFPAPVWCPWGSSPSDLKAPPAVPQLESGLPEGRGSGAPCWQLSASQ